MANILVVDDEPKMTSLVCGELEDAGHRVTTTTRPAEAIDLINQHGFDIVITDLSMPGISGMEILNKALARGGAEVVIMTAYGTIETAVEAMKKGASDYLLKPFPLEELVILVDKLVEKQRLQSLTGHFQQESRKENEGVYLGTSPALRKVQSLVEKVSPSDTTVLLTGSSGTGKEVVARRIHELSRRADNPFIAVNCAALTETLLESEMFGHEKGAFTGAVARKRGRFELADNGTIFLDEIGEMSPGLQSKLLRVLEERQVVRVGGVDSVNINARLITATNRDLKQRIETGNFREDLFYRLNVFPIALPQLSECTEDIVPLAQHFLEQARYKHARLTTEVSELLVQYDWPGNIRELRNVLERAMILAGGEPLSVDDFSLQVENQPLEAPGQPTARGLENTEKQMIVDALEKNNGNKTEAARLLKITRRRLYSRMKIHGIPIK